MNFIHLTRFLFFSSISLAATAAAAYEPPAPARAVETARFEWRDSVRARDVPAKVYFPKEGAGPFPIVIFSHGLGGSRENYEYLGRYWAGCGYVSVHLQHHGSDDSVWRDADGNAAREMLKSAANVRNAVDRPKDVSFAIDRLTALNAGSKGSLSGRLDLKKIGVAGHSFGGHTAMLIAGQTLPGAQAEFDDPRVRCAVQMSAPAARPAMRDKAYGSVHVPVFHLTGTKDDSPIGETTADERRIPYDHMAGVETCLLTFKDGDHMVFSGRPRFRGGDTAQDAKFQKLICIGTTAFWDAHLKGDEEAHTWLMDGGYARAVGASGTFEKKTARK